MLQQLWWPKTMHLQSRFSSRFAFLAMSAMLVLSACDTRSFPDAPSTAPDVTETYRIGPGDTLRVFVWGNPGLTETVPVRPDGRVSVPLLEDVEVANKTPAEVGREIEERLQVFIEDPLVTVIVSDFVGPFTQQVRVVGEAAEPQAIPYRADMTALDVMIEVGGLTEFAAGNRSTLVRGTGGETTEYRVRLGDLVRDGDITANVPMQPGDVLIIPESFF
jgi:polysaccharide export outer membrane protein